MQTSLTPQELLQIQKQEYQTLYSQFVLALDRPTMNRIKLQFTRQLSYPQFSDIIQKSTAWWNSALPDRQHFVERFIRDFFVNTMYSGATNIVFEEFTKYIIRKMTVLKTIKAETWEVPYVAHHKSIENYYRISKMLYLPFIKAICFFQQESNIIYFFDTAKFQPILKPLTVGKRKKEKNNQLYSKEQATTNTILLNMILIEIEDTPILLTSTNDRKIRGWCLGPVTFQQAYYPHNRHDDIVQKFSSQVYTMCWDHVNEIVYCGFKNGSISLWKISLNVVKPIPLEHNSMIMCMIALPRLYMLATGGIDGKVILWNIANEEKKWVYKQHTRGVLTMAYDQNSALLFSAGFDHQICIWNPYTSQLTNKLEIHQQPVISLCMGYNNNLISLDSLGIVKITNMKKWNTLLSYHSEATEASGIIYLQDADKVTLFGDKIRVLDYETNHNPNYTDNNPSICSLMISDSQMITVSGDVIKIWSLLIGTIRRTMVVPDVESISCCELFEDGVIIGDTRGLLLFARISDQPSTYRPLPKHPSQINTIKVLLPTEHQEAKRIIIGSTQLHLLSYSNNVFSTSSSVTLERCEASVVQYHQLTRSILVGTNIGSILIFSQKLVMRSHINICHSIINRIKFINNSTMCVIYDNRVDLIQITQNVMENKVISSVQTKSRVSALDVTLSGIVLVGLEKGILQCYNTAGSQSSSLNLVYQTRAHQDDIIHILCSEKHKIVVTSSIDRTVRVINMENGKLIDQLRQDIQRILRWRRIGKKEREEKEEKMWLERLKKECLNGLVGTIIEGEKERDKLVWNLLLELKEGDDTGKAFEDKEEEEIVEKEPQLQKQEKRSSSRVEQLKQIKIPLGRSISTNLDKPPPQTKPTPQQKPTPLHSSLKTKAQQRNISQQSLRRISLHAKQTFSKELIRMEKYRSVSLKPKPTSSLNQSLSKQNDPFFKLPHRLNTKLVSTSKPQAVSRPFLSFPTKNTKPVGNKFPRLK